MIEVPVLVNGHNVGHIDIHCTIPRGRQPDSINGYQATIRWTNQGDCYNGRLPHIDHVTVEHRFGDPWPVLLQKVLQELAIEPSRDE